MTRNNQTPDASSAPATAADSGSANGNANGRPSRGGKSIITHTNPSAFEGANSEIGAVLGLRHEKFKHKAPSYENFLEKISTYAISNFKDGGDLKPLFRRMVDPTENLRKKKKPSTPDTDTDTVDWDIYRKEVKEYVGRESSLRRNMEKTFGLIWGQCSSSLQSRIKGNSLFELFNEPYCIEVVIRILKKGVPLDARL